MHNILNIFHIIWPRHSKKDLAVFNSPVYELMVDNGGVSLLILQVLWQRFIENSFNVKYLRILTRAVNLTETLPAIFITSILRFLYQFYIVFWFTTIFLIFSVCKWWNKTFLAFILKLRER